MNKQQQHHKIRTQLIQKHNQLNLLLQEHVNRCVYLRQRHDQLEKINPEQAEAYNNRINLHKPQLSDLLEKITKLEKQINAIPKIWIA